MQQQIVLQENILSEYLDSQILLYYTNIQYTLEFLNDYKLELKVLCDLDVEDIYRQTIAHFDVN